MNKVYMVMGCTGEYSDHIEWPVCAYTSRELADKHADLAMEWAHKNKQQFRDSISQVYDKWFKHCAATGEIKAALGNPNFDDFYVQNTLKSPYDPTISMDYTGTDYFVLEVEIREQLPEIS